MKGLSRKVINLVFYAQSAITVISVGTNNNEATQMSTEKSWRGRVWGGGREWGGVITVHSVPK